MRFDQLTLCAPILRAVADSGYQTATPIQARAIPAVLEGRDVLGCAQTGTGKTAAFALPILHNLFAGESNGAKRHPRPKCLVLAPTRELAGQIAEGFQAYGKHLKVRGAVIFGGVGQNPQVDKLRRGIDVLIATPGRLMDLMNQGHVDLRSIEVLVLDEADRMLDMGFINDIRKIVAKVPADRQTLFFSATMPPEIKKLADAMLNDPVTIQIAPDKPAADRVAQSVYFVGKSEKADLFAKLFDEKAMFRAIAFTRTKYGADKLVRQLHQRGIKSQAIHGNKTQNNRQKALDQFKNGKIHVLVATDIAARGIDVDQVCHVINYDVTHEPETYIHRIGRTARAGQEGCAIALCDREEVGNLRAIEKLLGQPIPVAGEKPDWADATNVPLMNGQQKRQPRGGGRPNNSGNGNTGSTGPAKRRRKRSRGAKTGGAGAVVTTAHAASAHNQPKPKRRRNRSKPRRSAGV